MSCLDTIPSQDNLCRIIQNVARILTPPPDMSVSEWADNYRYLSSEYNPEPGKWHTDSAPYQREMMDIIKQREVNTVVVMASSQVGKSEGVMNIKGYFISEEPCPILMIQPTLEMAEAWSKERLAPTVRDTPCLSEKIKIRSRDGDNTILHKTFPGGHITMAGANSPASLASRPIRVLLLDEVDRYPQSAGNEGDPVNIASKRTTRFWNRLIYMVSTPTIKGQSRIAAAYEASDKRIYEVPCPHCGEYDQLRFANLIRPYEDAPAEEWQYICQHCGSAIHENEKMGMLRKGRWRATAPFKGTAGFHINELYSPWVRWTEMVANFLEAKKLPDTLKTFVNTSLAEVWDPDMEGDGVNSEAIHERTEEYKAQVPAGVYLLTAAVDVQDDRLECEILGWGMDRETWSIDYRVLWGDPATSDVWQQLDDVILQPFKHESGISLRIKTTVVDSGGHHTEEVYRYVKKKRQEKRRFFALRGHSVRNQPIKAKISRNNSYRVPVIYVGTDTAKELIYSYLNIDKHGPGYMHHPSDYDEEYFNQLTAERKVKAFEKGKHVVKWVKPSGKRNEALDLKVYNFAAYADLQPNMAMVRKRIEDLIAHFNEKKEQHSAEDSPQNKATPVRTSSARQTKQKKKGGFVKNY